MSSMFDLSGKVAVVTGASRGIGFAMAEALAEAGADIIAISATLPRTGSAVGAMVASYGRAFQARAVDFADREAVLALGAELAELAPDILVNNAGTIERAPAIEHPLELWDRVIEINLSSQFALTQLVARPMIEGGYGKVIFTASLLSFQGGINVPGYTASKSGISGLTKALANEWAVRGVNVNAIAPGYIATDNTKALRADPVRSKSILDRIPEARWGTPEDIAGGILYLASKEADYLNGTIMNMDGGWLAR